MSTIQLTQLTTRFAYYINSHMRLIDSKVLQEVRVVGFESGCRSKERLLQLGIVPGVILKIKRLAPFAGPLIVSIEGSDVVLGRGIAKKIIVEEI